MFVHVATPHRLGVGSHCGRIGRFVDWYIPNCTSQPKSIVRASPPHPPHALAPRRRDERADRERIGRPDRVPQTTAPNAHLARAAIRSVAVQRTGTFDGNLIAAQLALPPPQLHHPALPALPCCAAVDQERVAESSG